MCRLLDAIPLEKLTVADICKLAGTSRATFYRYFAGKYEVFQWFLKTSSTPNIAQTGIFFNWHDSHIKFFEIIWANRKMVGQFVNDKKIYTPFEDLVFLYRSSLTECAIQHCAGETPPRKILMQIRYLSLTFAEIVSDWVKEDGSQSPEETTELFLSFVPEELFSLLDSPVGKSSFDEIIDQDRSPLLLFIAEEKVFREQGGPTV